MAMFDDDLLSEEDLNNIDNCSVSICNPCPDLKSFCPNL